MVKEWCNGWKPDAFITDKCAAETKAIKETFPGLLFVLRCIGPVSAFDYQCTINMLNLPH